MHTTNRCLKSVVTWHFGGVVVPNVMIDCPATGKPVATGFAMSAEAFAAAKLSGNETDECPHCGQMHIWEMKEAYLEGSRPPRPETSDDQKTS